MSKSVWFILIFLLIIEFFPESVINKKEEFVFDRPRNEGFIAFIVNEKVEDSNNNEDEDDDDDESKCSCNGSEVIIHGDGHRTPCPCVSAGGECKCSKKKVKLSIPTITPNKTDWNSLEQQH